MKIKPTEIDGRVGEAFDGLIQWANDSCCLGRIAQKPGGQHERNVTDAFYCQLLEHEWADVDLPVEHSQGSFRRDIVGLSNSVMIFAFEIKTPFTNPGGISDKTNKEDHLPKDLDSLKTALDAGAVRAYYLWTPIGCYPVDEYGRMIEGSNEYFKNQYGIKWPTSRNYEATGKKQVDDAMKAGAEKRSLKATKIKGWKKVDLPRPRSGIYAFLDCALFRISKKH